MLFLLASMMMWCQQVRHDLKSNNKGKLESRILMSMYWIYRIYGITCTFYKQCNGCPLTRYVQLHYFVYYIYVQYNKQVRVDCFFNIPFQR